MSDNRFGRRRVWEDTDQGPTSVRCKIRSFAQFSRWMDGELAKLERNWAHLVPAQRRPSNSRHWKPKPR